MDDELTYSSVFHDIKTIYSAPKDLESFYRDMGSRNFSLFLHTQYYPEHEVSSPKGASTFRDRVLERLGLYIPQNTPRRQRLDEMRDLSVFRVKIFKHISVKTTLSFSGTHTVTRTSAAGYSDVQRSSDAPLFELWIADSGNIDYFE